LLGFFGKKKKKKAPGAPFPPLGPLPFLGGFGRPPQNKAPPPRGALKRPKKKKKKVFWGGKKNPVGSERERPEQPPPGQPAHAATMSPILRRLLDAICKAVFGALAPLAGATRPRRAGVPIGLMLLAWSEIGPATVARLCAHPATPLLPPPGLMVP